MRASLTAVAICAGAIAAVGCSRSGDENLGLSARPQKYDVDLTQLSHPAELVRAASMPGREVDRKLGAHRFDATSTIKIETSGRPTEILEESWRLNADGRGDFHAVHENNRGYGFEATVANGDLYVRPRYGKMVERRPEGDELDRLRATVDGVGGDTLALLERWLLVREDGRTQVAGRPAIRLKLSATASPASAPIEQDPAKSWRNSMTVRYADGEALLDAQTGALVGLRLEAAYSFERDEDGKKTPFTVNLAYKLASGAPEAIATPTDFVVAPHRTRPMIDRSELLEGLK